MVVHLLKSLVVHLLLAYITEATSIRVLLQAAHKLVLPQRKRHSCVRTNGILREHTHGTPVSNCDSLRSARPRTPRKSPASDYVPMYVGKGRGVRHRRVLVGGGSKL